MLISSNNVFVFVAKHAFSLLFRRSGYHCIICGIFVGVLAMALAEVLNVMPILMRRARLNKGITWFVVSFALGKLLGSLLYFLKDGFYQLP